MLELASINIEEELLCIGALVAGTLTRALMLARALAAAVII
jgi:hypothetical protein